MLVRSLLILSLATLVCPVGGSLAQEAAPEPAQETPEAARRARPLARFEGGQVTIGDLEDAIARQSPFMRKRYEDPDEMQKLLAKTVRFALLAEEARRQGFDQRPSVQQAVKQNAVQALMRVEFDEKLSADTISKDQVQQYYDEHIDEYVRPATRRASHIMVATLEEATQILEQARDADLREFRKLARDKTMDEASKMRGGDLRYFDASGKLADEETPSIPEPLAEAAFKLKTVGDLAIKPVKLEGGFSIIKLTGSRPALSRKVEEVAETIRVRLWRTQRQSAIDKFVTDLRAQYKPAIDAALIEKIEIGDHLAAKGTDIPAGFPTHREEPGDPQ